MGQQKKLNRQGQEYINYLLGRSQQIYQQILRAEGIPENEAFVNQEVIKASSLLPYYDQAMKLYWAAREQYRAGGYVGLRIGRR